MDSRAMRENDDFFSFRHPRGSRKAQLGDPFFTAFAVVALQLDSQPAAENDDRRKARE